MSSASASTVRHFRRLLNRRKSDADGLNSESLDSLEFHPDDKLHEVHAILRQTPSEEIEDPAAFKVAMDSFMRYAGIGLRQLDKGFLDHDDSRIALEAVVRTDGTRPSLLVRNNTVDANHPMAGSWKASLEQTLPSLQPRLAAVGRLEPVGGGPKWYFGTGWLVSKDESAQSGLVLTNLHVLAKMYSSLSYAMLPNGKGGYRFLGPSAYIDFAAESGSLERRRFQIVEGAPSGIDGPQFQRLDAAVLKIVPVDGEPAPAWPDPIPLAADLDATQGVTDSFCVVGCPGPPPYPDGVHEGVDWAWVHKTLFGARYGVKRLAPGQVHKPLGAIPNDHNPPWVFGHDATTLGGNSGSPLLSWLDAPFGAFGLHFAGVNADSNFAHSLVQARDQLVKLGVPWSL